MPISDYLRGLRDVVGSRPLLMPSAAVAVIDRDGRLLVGLHEEAGVWVIPGGAVDPGESPSDAAVRETWEETGIEVSLHRLVGVFGGSGAHRIEYPNGDIVDYVVSVFEGRPLGGHVHDGAEELHDLRWLEIDAVRALDVAAWMPEVLDAIEDPHRSFIPPSWAPPEHRPE